MIDFFLVNPHFAEEAVAKLGKSGFLRDFLISVEKIKNGKPFRVTFLYFFGDNHKRSEKPPFRLLQLPQKIKTIRCYGYVL